MVWVPTEQEIENCLMGKSCEYGICSECSQGKAESEVEEDSEE